MALLLALAEIVDWWGVLVIPAAVAVMVKLNDPSPPCCAARPPSLELDRPRLAGGLAIGVSPRPTTAHLTTWINDDDAVADPAAQPHPRGHRNAGPSVTASPGALPPIIEATSPAQSRGSVRTILSTAGATGESGPFAS